MISEKYCFMQYSVANVLEFVKSGDYAVPEIQRPFVWKRTQVKDLIDSLYHGYPTGYIIIWKNPDVKTKDGTISKGRKLLIDGQQRVTALMAALLGNEVLDEEFDHVRICIAFNPLETDDTKRFAVQDASHKKDTRWIPDISVLFASDFNMFNFVEDYARSNPGIERSEVSESVQAVKNIANRNIGVIELDQRLGIEEVTEIFIRINSKGTILNQADFVMSKMAADADNGGDMMWRAVDYFCHTVAKPEFSSVVMKDEAFMKSEFGSKITWLFSGCDDVSVPEYGDVLRVAFMHFSGKGKMKDLVSLLSGRDFLNKEYREDVVVETYSRMKSSLGDFFNEYNYKQFILAMKGAGFIDEKLLNSRMTMDFAYALYLNLHDDPSVPSNEQLKRDVQRWFVMSMLTNRYIGSPESAMDRDLRMIREKGFERFLKEIEASELSDVFWEVTMPSKLETSSPISPSYLIYLAAQIRKGCSSLFMDGMKISDIVSISGDVHHIFPREYLKSYGIGKNMYNQVANYAYIDTQVNKSIGKEAPSSYFSKVVAQCNGGPEVLGNIRNMKVLAKNMAENCIPSEVIGMDHTDYAEFLTKRRKLMSEAIREYYESLRRSACALQRSADYNKT